MISYWSVKSDEPERDRFPLKKNERERKRRLSHERKREHERKEIVILYLIHWIHVSFFNYL